MDLALHLGLTVDGLKRAMTEREFVDWQVYARDRILPWRRVELYLAQIALWIAQSMGGVKNATLADFMFDKRAAEAAGEELSADDVAAFFGAELVRRREG